MFYELNISLQKHKLSFRRFSPKRSLIFLLEGCGPSLKSYQQRACHCCW